MSQARQVALMGQNTRSWFIVSPYNLFHLYPPRSKLASQAIQRCSYYNHDRVQSYRSILDDRFLDRYIPLPRHEAWILFPGPLPRRAARRHRNRRLGLRRCHYDSQHRLYLHHPSQHPLPNRRLGWPTHLLPQCRSSAAHAPHRLPHGILGSSQLHRWEFRALGLPNGDLQGRQ